jgi:quercetin 2,3-dioxygenase
MLPYTVERPRQPGVEVRRAAERFRTDAGWLASRHSFSFGPHYDPRNTHFGLLLVNNDDVVAPGTGFETHPHRDMEIVTWVLSGQLVHQDSQGHSGVIYPGLAQRMSAGTGILHSEKNDASRLAGHGPDVDPVHFVQMWVVPDAQSVRPGYEQLEIPDRTLRSGLITVASGMPRDLGGSGAAAIRIGQRHAALHVARMAPGETVTLPDAPYLHFFVGEGSAALEGAGVLDRGDAARISDGGGRLVTVPDDAPGAEILVWEMHAAIAA